MSPSPTRTARSSFRRCGTALLVLPFLALGLGLMGAADSPPVPVPPAATAGPFSVTAPSFSPTTAVLVQGAKDAGSGVSVLPQIEGDAPACTVTPSSDTTWSCTIALPSGPSFTVTATELVSGAVSDQATTTVAVLGAPTISGAAGFVTSGLVSGSAYPGATVTVRTPGTAACTSLSTLTGYWSCSLGVPSGSYRVTANQASSAIGGGASSSDSGSLDVVVDKEAPAAPTILSPHAGARMPEQIAVFTGTGEDAAMVDLYIDNIPVCSALVNGSSWSCSASGITAEPHSVVAIQHDGAGNFSPPSSAIRVFFGPRPLTPAPSAAPSTPPGASPAPSPTPSPQAVVPPVQPPAPPAALPPGTPDTWETPTSFGATIPTVDQSIASGDWLLAPLIAVGFLLLIALPLRLAATALGARSGVTRVRLFGRNRVGQNQARRRDQDAPSSSPRLIGVVLLAAAAGFIVISGGVNDELRYLRLTLAVVLGLVVLNLIPIALESLLAGRWQGIGGRLRLLPVLLSAAALTTVFSRVTEMTPPLLSGVLIGVTFASGLPIRPRAIAGLAQIATTALMAAAAWIAHGTLANASGFWSMTLRETLATVALAGMGSAVVMLLPVATLPGRTLFEWSPSAWIATLAVVSTLAAVVFLGGSSALPPLLEAFGIAAAFAAVSIAIWGWLRFVEPETPRIGA